MDKVAISKKQWVYLVITIVVWSLFLRLLINLMSGSEYFVEYIPNISVAFGFFLAIILYKFYRPLFIKLFD